MISTYSVTQATPRRCQTGTLYWHTSGCVKYKHLTRVTINMYQLQTSKKALSLHPSIRLLLLYACMTLPHKQRTAWEVRQQADTSYKAYKAVTNPFHCSHRPISLLCSRINYTIYRSLTLCNQKLVASFLDSLLWNVNIEVVQAGRAWYFFSCKHYTDYCGVLLLYIRWSLYMYSMCHMYYYGSTICTLTRSGAGEPGNETKELDGGNA